ncbi:MAG: tetratricopeptide repeat protein, partial [Gemmatimonadota bacterium]|nr:tetratricopeptide repeat protein [Gemmatimonadota bacterium]
SGESLRSVQGGPALNEVTTASLEALQLYTRAEMIAGDDLASIELFERATVLDPEFAMAHRKLATMLGNARVRPGDRVAAYMRAYELRERLPDSERYLAEADYEELVRGDRDAAIRAFENLLQIDAQNIAGLNNLGLLYWSRGRLEEAEELFVTGLEALPFEVAFLNLARIRLNLRKIPEMHAALDSGLAALPEAASVFEHTRVQMTISAGDYDRASELAGGYLEGAVTPVERRRSAQQAFLLASIRGRLAEAERHIEDFDLAPGGPAHPMRLARTRARLAAARGDTAAAVSGLLAAYAVNQGTLSGPDLVYEDWLPDLAALGGGAEAVTIYEEWKRAIPPEQLGTNGRDSRRAIDARLATLDGRLEEAMRLWDEYQGQCPGWCALDASLGRARIHDGLGDRQSAIREYEAYLADPAFFRQNRDSFEKGPALERLAQLYDAEGDSGNAARVYTEFVTLWDRADEVLQPRVGVARQRLDQLGGASQ